ncbi:MAG: hypothetical protein MI754_16590, partial [Chromatiales bacterium]|nr:hypothetical protein [Chromatiales bacterium]
LLDTIEQQLSEYLGRSGKPVGDYKKLLDNEAELAERLASVEQQLSDYNNLIDRLQQLQERQNHHTQEQSLKHAEQQLTEAQQEAGSMERLRKQLDDSATALKLAETALRLPESQWLARQELIQNVSRLQTSIEQIAESLQQLDTRQIPLQQQRIEAQSTLEQRKTAQAALQQKIDEAHHTKTLWDQQQRYQLLVRNLEHAQHTLSRCDAIKRELSGIRVNATDIDRLNQLTNRLRDTQTAIELAGTQVIYQLNPGVTLTADDRPLTGNGELSISKPTDIELPELGKLQIRPRGEDLEALNKTLKDIQTERQQLLEHLGVSSLDEARQLLQQQQNLTQELTSQQAAMKPLIPQGIELLATEVEQLNQQLAGHTVPEQQPNEATPLKLKQEQNRVTAEIEQFARQLEQLDGESKRHSDERLTLESRSNTNRETLTQQEQRLADERALETDQALAQRLEKARADIEQKQQLFEQAQANFSASNPQQLQLQVERAQISHDNLVAELDQLNSDIMALRNQLIGMGHSGLAEEHETLSAEQQRLAVLVTQQRNQAEALELLHTELKSALQATKSVITEPVMRKMQPYLDILMPDSQAVIADDMGLQGLSRAGIDEAFEQLSIGTREQLAVIIRLAYADLLHAAGQPVCLFLDDALVYSDDRRRDLMKQILFTASRKYQINLLTCHESAYRDAGATIIRLADHLENTAESMTSA